MKAVLIALTMFGAAMAVPKNPQRIVGGEATTIQTYPYMSSMIYGWFGIIWYQACGGALLTSTAILSAAHCYHGDQASSWRVQVGSSLPETGGFTINVARIINHGLYNDNTIDNDVSMIHLASPAVFSDNVGVAQIAGPNYRLPDHTPLTAIGWGTTSSGGSSPGVLHHVEINKINQQICAERYAYLKTLPGYANWPDITDRMLCAGILNVGGKDACQGDSGGPLSHNRIVVYGVTSWGYSCANGTYPGVNAYVPEFADWIVANAS